MPTQYFGRNKPRYRDFNFRVLSTPHFNVHHYLKNEVAAQRIARMADQWYHYHSQVMEIVSNTKPHYPVQQPPWISSRPMPYRGQLVLAPAVLQRPLKQGSHAPWLLAIKAIGSLGSRVVHAFQFYTILNGDSCNLQSLGNLPLWMVEGMAEYMSLGRVDPFTSMWMRDAVIQNDVPSLMNMDDPNYFPYRYGQAFWSFMTGTYGDGVIAPLFTIPRFMALPILSELTLQLSVENLFQCMGQWRKNHYAPFFEIKKLLQVKIILSIEFREPSTCPSLSPNGRYVVFCLRKTCFLLTFSLADARTGKIPKYHRLSKTAILTISTIWNHPVAWSPDGKDFAFVGIKRVKMCWSSKMPMQARPFKPWSFREWMPSPIQHGRPIN